MRGSRSLKIVRSFGYTREHLHNSPRSLLSAIQVMVLANSILLSQHSSNGLSRHAIMAPITNLEQELSLSSAPRLFGLGSIATRYFAQCKIPDAAHTHAVYWCKRMFLRAFLDFLVHGDWHGPGYVPNVSSRCLYFITSRSRLHSQLV